MNKHFYKQSIYGDKCTCGNFMNHEKHKFRTSKQPLRDKIVQIIEVHAIFADEEESTYKAMGLSESGKVYLLVKGEWKLLTDSPLLPVTEEK